MTDVLWTARWIGPTEDEATRAGVRPAYLLRHDFGVSTMPSQATLFATAHGIYECFLNGRRVGDMELTPGFTGYDTRVQVQTFDVRDLLVPGTNRWEVLLSDGWYRGCTSINQRRDAYGTEVAFFGQLHLDERVVATDAGWTWDVSQIVAADLMRGQTTDLRRVPNAAHPVRVSERGTDTLCWSPAPPVRRTEELRPVRITALADGAQVVDLGQNINGWVRLAVAAPAGAELMLTHGEALWPNGDVRRDHLDAFDRTTGDGVDAGMVDRVISRGVDGDVFEPRHTTHGFQYVRIDGAARPLTPDDVTGIMVHTDLRAIGTFACSDERVNWLHEATRWSFRGNACDIPTDCPHRERMGWTGDYQLFLPSAAFLYDVGGFSRKWLLDLMAEQEPSGRILNVAPDPLRLNAARTNDAIWNVLQGSAGWGDAIAIVPWELYLATGDSRYLAECLDSMVRWVAFAADIAARGRHESRIARSAEPAPHEQFLWDTGFHWGEWHEPDAPEMTAETFMADKGHVATAFLHRSAAIVAAAARVVGRDELAAHHEALAAGALDAWRREYLDADGRITPDTQANHVRALAFGLIPDEFHSTVAARLVELIAEAGGHLGTGFLSTPFLLPVLADTGHLDVAYDVLLQDTPPSWMAMRARGATTVWENWEGIDADGVPHDSLNHYSKGAVITFLHRYVAGLQLLQDHPGYRRFRVAPRPGGGLTWAEATHESPHGPIRVAWRIADGAFHLTVAVPPGTTAEVVLPDGSVREQAPGEQQYVCCV
jgi:alpha-L-rhamnosidase